MISTWKQQIGIVVGAQFPDETKGRNMSNTPELESLQQLIQEGAPLPTHGFTEATHIGADELPFVDIGDGSSVQVLQIDLNQGLWVIRTRFKPGYSVNKHYHTGPVFAVTEQGRWYYKEYPDMMNTAGSYLYEPAHSVHTLMVPEDNTEDTVVWFSIFGANVDIDTDGNFAGIVDAQRILMGYRLLCDAQGLSHDKVIVIGEPS